MQEVIGAIKCSILAIDMKNYIYPLILAVFLIFYKKIEAGQAYEPRLVVFFVSIVSYYAAYKIFKKRLTNWIRIVGFLIVYSVVWFSLIIMPLFAINLFDLPNQAYIINLFNSLSFARFYFFETLTIAFITYTIVKKQTNQNRAHQL